MIILPTITATTNNHVNPPFEFSFPPFCVPATVPLIPANLADALDLAGGDLDLLNNPLLSPILLGIGGANLAGAGAGSSSSTDDLQTRDPFNGFFGEFDAFLSRNYKL